MTMTEASTEMTAREVRDMERFLEEIRVGVGPLNAAIGIGWSPAKLRKLMADPEFVELVNIAEERQLETIEESLKKMAAGGHFKAMQMVLHNRRPDRWRDVRHIEVASQHTVDIGVVVAVKQASLELLREQGVAALQPSTQDIIDVESSDSGD